MKHFHSQKKDTKHNKSTAVGWVTSTAGCTITGSDRCSKDVPVYSALPRPHLEHEAQTTLSPSIPERIKINWSEPREGNENGTTDSREVAEESGLYSAWRREKNLKALGWCPREAIDTQLSSFLRCTGRATSNQWDLKQRGLPGDIRKEKIPHKKN